MEKWQEVKLGMGQYLLIPFLVGWTSIYQLFWGSLGVQGFDPSPSWENEHGLKLDSGSGSTGSCLGFDLKAVKVGFWTGEDRKSTSQSGDLRFLEGRGWGWYTIYCIILYLYIYIYIFITTVGMTSDALNSKLVLSIKKSRPSGSWAWHVAGFVEFGPVPTKIDIFQMHNLGSLQIFQVTTYPRIHGCSHPHYSFLHLCWKPISNIVITLW